MENLRQKLPFGKGVEKGLKIVAIFDFAFGLFCSLFTILALIMLMTNLASMQPDSEATEEDKVVYNVDNNDETSDPSELQATPLSTILLICVCLIIWSLSNMGLEMWLSWMLYGAAKHGDAFALRKWWWLRMCLTIFEFSAAIARVLGVQEDVTDWAVPTIFAYRMSELVGVSYFRRRLY